MSTNYSVEIESFAERHFIKNFKKKYKNAWEVTRRAITEELKRLDLLLKTSIAQTIIKSEKVDIIKIEFKIAGTSKSRKASGNRCIVAVHKDTRSVYALLVYHKNDLKKGKETACFKQMIKDNYDKYKELL